MTEVKNPVQPVVLDNGVLRFKENRIVRYLLDAGPVDMNALSRMDFSDDDRTQFAQLIGYSLGGASELSYFDDEIMVRARASFSETALHPPGFPATEASP